MRRSLALLTLLLPTTAHAAYTGGWLPGIAPSLSTTVITIKTTGPGQLGSLLCYNPNSAVAYVQIFNATTANVTLGTTVPTWFLPVQATTMNGFNLPIGSGYQFSTAISIAATTTPLGSTANSTALSCSFGYQ